MIGDSGEMVGEADARARAAAWLREHGVERQEDRMRLTKFDHGWLVSFPSHDQPPDAMPELGGVRLIVDKEDGAVHSFPTNRPPSWTIREYSERKLAEG